MEYDAIKGLSEKEVKERTEAGKVNRMSDSANKTYGDIVRENTLTYFNMIFLILAILVCLVGSFRSLTFLPVIIVNIIVGIVQECRAKSILDKMDFLHAPKSIVCRDGKEETIPTEQIVLDDVIRLKTGMQIPADAVVLAGEAAANESMITGESDELRKQQGDRLFSGSFIVSGDCYARVTEVGDDCYIAKIAAEAKKMKTVEQSEMIRSIDTLIKWIGVMIIPIGIALFSQSYFMNKETITTSVVSMVAAVIGMIPEGLYLLTTLALVVGTMRLARRDVILHNMKSIETLARVDVLCVDKTGTITTDEMAVETVVWLGAGNEDLLADFVGNMSADNSTMKALQEMAKDAPQRRAQNIIPFSSRQKYCGLEFDEQSYVLGAPEIVLKGDYERYAGQVREYVESGYRVLVFGTYAERLDGEALHCPISPLAFVVLSNRVRPNAAQIFEYLDGQDVTIKVISGDNPVTVSRIAKRVGIADYDAWVDASTLRTEEDYQTAVEQYAIFGRTTPEQKKMLVQAMQKAGHTVGMTGDGVNDILAMKTADCSIAMASGSDAAAQASQVVLLQSDFSCMPDIIREGRKVVNNIERSASLFLVKNIFSLLLAILSVAFAITYPLEPSQISYISMFTIGIPAFFLAMEPNKNRIRGHFLRNVFHKALPAGLTDVFIIGALVFCGDVLKINSTDIATVSTLLLAVVGFMILVTICEPMNRLRMAILIGNLIGLVFCGIFFSDLFALNWKHLSTVCVVLLVIFAFAASSVYRLLTLFFGLFDKKQID